MIPTDCSVLRTPAILPNIRISRSFASLLCSYWGGSLSHNTTLVQAHRGIWLLTLVSLESEVHKRIILSDPDAVHTEPEDQDQHQCRPYAAFVPLVKLSRKWCDQKHSCQQCDQIPFAVFQIITGEPGKSSRCSQKRKQPLHIDPDLSWIRDGKYQP